MIPVPWSLVPDLCSLSLTRTPPRLYGCANPDAFAPQEHMNSPRLQAVLTDSHFLIPLAVFCIGLALLITLH